MPPVWRFGKQPKGININPIQGEFFRTDSLESIADALVREAIQNSLDAALPNAKVTVKFIFDLTPDKNISEKRKDLLSSLWPHLKAPDTGLTDIPSKTSEVPVLLVEDFGTRGLQGDPQQYEDLEGKGQKNDFYYFWRNVGRGKKEGIDRGRWGLGKTVFQAASRINSFWGITTINGNEKKTLLMGQSILKIHKIGDDRFSPYGYYGNFMDQDFAIPIENSTEIAYFNSIFPIDRLEKPGFSVVIPYPVEDISPTSVVHSIIKHYSIPILAKELNVEIREKGGISYVIDQISIENLILSLAWREKEKEKAIGLLKLAKWGLQKSDPDLEVKSPAIELAPKLKEDLFDQERLEACRELFIKGDKLAIKLSIFVKKKTHNPKLSSFMMYVEKDPSIEYSQDCFIRNGITIPEVSSLKFKGVRAIVMVTDKEISELLGDAENPAHTDWERSSERLKKKFEHGPSTLGYIKNSPREMISLFMQPCQGRDETSLSNIFPMLQNENRGDNQITRSSTIPPLPPPSIRIEKTGSGFRIASVDHQNLLNKLVYISAAYELSRGNPFKKYAQNDFDFKSDQIMKELEGVSIKKVLNNQIYLLIEKNEFSIKITGFDENRDLRLKVVVEEKVQE